MTRVQGLRKFTIEKTLRPKAEGFINGKFPKTEDEGRIFVVYTVIAMVHMIYIMKKSY